MEFSNEFIFESQESGPNYFPKHFIVDDLATKI